MRLPSLIIFHVFVYQASLLKLREKALTEKTKAELSWLEQQKQRIRNKGADDTYPQIIKRQRGLKMRLQEQQVLSCLILTKLCKIRKINWFLH